MKEPETLQDKVARVLAEPIVIVPYDPSWPQMFLSEKHDLEACLPRDLIRRIEHVGSTAVPGLCAKPIVDLLVEVTDLDDTRRRIAPILEARNYDYFWRPSWGDDTPPFYAWFIKRNPSGVRTHHIHMVEAGFPQWDWLTFRDHLIAHPESARQYGQLKQELADRNLGRVAYTRAKGDFIRAALR